MASHEEELVPDEGDMDVKAMMKKMMSMMGGLSEDMQAVKAGAAQANAKAENAVDIAARTEANMKELQASAERFRG